MEILSTPEFWVAVSFFIFLGALFYFGVHKKVATLLDARAAQIARELEEARRLREEAEKVLADYRRKQSEAGKEADSIIALAAKEAEMLAAECHHCIRCNHEGRTRLARAGVVAFADRVLEGDVLRLANFEFRHTGRPYGHLDAQRLQQRAAPRRRRSQHDRRHGRSSLCTLATSGFGYTAPPTGTSPA